MIVCADDAWWGGACIPLPSTSAPAPRPLAARGRLSFRAPAGGQAPPRAAHAPRETRSASFETCAEATATNRHTHKTTGVGGGGGLSLCRQAHTWSMYHTRGGNKKNGRETKQVETGRTQSGRCTNSLPSGKRLRLHRRHGRACELHWEQEQRPSAEGVGRGRKKCVCTSTRWGQPAMSANMFACSRLEFSKFNAFLCPLALRPWLDKVGTPARGKRAVSSSCPIPFRRLVHISAHRLQSHRTAHLFDPPRT